MSVKKSDVSTAFDLLLSTIDEFRENCKFEAKRKLDHDKHREVQKSVKVIENLRNFHRQVESLKEKWRREFKTKTTKKASLVHEPTGPSKIKPHTKLIVTFPDGKRIDHSIAAKTFAETIREIGDERVESLGLNLSGIPLLSPKKPIKYSSSFYKADTLYVNTHSSTEGKRKILEDVASKLSVRIKVEVVPKTNKEAKNTDLFDKMIPSVVA